MQSPDIGSVSYDGGQTWSDPGWVVSSPGDAWGPPVPQPETVMVDVTPTLPGQSPPIGSVTYDSGKTWVQSVTIEPTVVSPPVVPQPAPAVIVTPQAVPVFGGGATQPVQAVFGGTPTAAPAAPVAPADLAPAVIADRPINSAAPAVSDIRQPVTTEVHPVATPNDPIYLYVHSLAWGTPARDAIAVPLLAAKAKAMGWTDAQIAASTGFTATDIANMWTRYGVTAGPGSGMSTGVLLAIAAAGVAAMTLLG